MKIVISSGHGKYVRGASGILDEVDEARRVVNEVQRLIGGADCISFHDDVSKTQNENLNRIVDFHNSKKRDLDVSVHFNAYQNTSKPMGTECLYVTQLELAREVADGICLAGGLINRGPKKRTDLFFLNNTSAPAILIEVCFVDSEADAVAYEGYFKEICSSIAETITGVKQPGPSPEPSPEPEPEPPKVLFYAQGKCSWFGGPQDMGVSPSEGLAFIFSVEEAPHLFLPFQPPGTTGLARRLNPYVHFVACRWDYDVTPKDSLRDAMVWVKAKKTGIGMGAFPADWGPNENTDRIADLSQGLMTDLGITTDDEVEVTLLPEAGV